MDFSLTDEQRMLADTLERLIADRVAPEQRRALLEAPAGERSALWQTFAELGLLHMPFAEQVGGLGGDGTDLMLIMQALGRGLVPEAYLAGLVLPGDLLARLGDAGQRKRWLAPLLEGEHQLALAWQEGDARYDAHGIATTACREGDGWRLDGDKQLVLNAASAIALLVTARLDDGRLGLFVVPADAAGLSRRDYRTIDDQSASNLALEAVSLSADACLSADAANALDATLALGRAALCAEAVGTMEVACEQTLDYLKERQQFGTPLSRFQSLQHRMVDMHLHLEQARSMAILAATSLDRPAAERDYRLAAAKAYCGEAARFVAEQAIQLHGGMGMTDECHVSHYAKHLVMFDHYLGDCDHHLEHVSDQLETAA
ncbi:acyl-CoA dehydrogenase family protein [Halomonas heilongjiangensis]|uniref:Acyl-CoA dehydrogenase n=1 Tax=Halomonas heilongjiangensis TaxID=1387883 RepID=A0A2N7TI19_9GAMM|nr:acyl-CoA dehydrogenase [Halomonas heilongjiangensis]PMR67840.1 acyl-CoA dehydrogenase [Halomonas heilongjiangensis]PXX88859.1 acyl-CoA dehydrogenase [Halomonas heilongjiangensis]